MLSQASGATDTTAVRHQVEDFLNLEAELLDDQQYEQWLGLWVPGELSYWLPMRNGETDRTRLSIICDDRGMLEKRIERLLDDWVLIQEPRSRMSRIVSNIRHTEVDGRLTVRSVLFLTEFRRNEHIYWSARAEHQLVRINDELRIAAKRVDLVNSEAEIRAISFLF